MSRYYHGPVSDHFDGERFFDPDGAPPRSRRDLLRWRSVTGAAPGRSGRPGRHRPMPTGRRPASRAPAWRISYVGHASFLIQTAGLNILLDPVWSKRASPFRFVGPKRVNDPGIAFADLPPIDTVLVSHGHYDHLDRRYAVAACGRAPSARHHAARQRHDHAQPRSRHRRRRLRLAAIGSISARGLAVTPVATRHWSARNLSDRNMSLWASFIIETPAGRIYFVADSGYGDGRHFRNARKGYGPFRLAILPIGAYEPRWFMREQHMNPAEAVQAFLDCNAELALGHHYGTFQLTDEAIDAPLVALADALQAAGIPPARVSRVAARAGVGSCDRDPLAWRCVRRLDQDVNIDDQLAGVAR